MKKKEATASLAAAKEAVWSELDGIFTFKGESFSCNCDRQRVHPVTFQVFATPFQTLSMGALPDGYMR